MLRNRIQRIGLLVAGGLVLALAAPSGWAVEMRTTSGKKTIIRRASLQAGDEKENAGKEETLPPPAPDAAAPVTPTPRQPAFTEPAFVQPGVEFEVGDGGCYDACVPTCCLPCLSGRLWTEVDFLLWWRKGRFFPPLVTTQPNDAILPTATILFGGQRVDESPRPGGRVELGVWLGPCARFGLGGSFLALADAPVNFSITDADFSLFGRPFTNAATGTQTAQLIASDVANPQTTGQLDLRSTSEVLVSDAFARWAIWRGCGHRLDFLAGYQFARIDEDLRIDTFTQTTGTIFPTLAVTDVFSMRNEFHGGHFGLLGQYQFGRVGLELRAKFAFGNMRETATISGHRISQTAAAARFEANRGLLAMDVTNGGVHVQDDFSYMQDVGVKLSYCPVERLRVSLGYSLLYWSSVLRPGNQIDLLVDPNLLTNNPPVGNEVHPAFQFNPKGMYVHGLNVGIEYNF
jgi:hypothetical protein